MKKLVIVAALACVAFFAEASQVNWKFQTNVSGQKGYTVYLVADVPAGGFTQTGENSIANHLLGSSGNSGTIGGTRSPFGASGTVDGLDVAAGTTVDFYYIIVDPNNSSAGYWQVAGSAEAYTTSTTHDDSTIGAAAGAAALNGTKTAWSTGGGGGGGEGGAPEPTSGMLLLVGGALLGLRRKRA